MTEPAIGTYIFFDVDNGQCLKNTQMARKKNYLWFLTLIQPRKEHIHFDLNL